MILPPVLLFASNMYETNYQNNAFSSPLTGITILTYLAFLLYGLVCQEGFSEKKKLDKSGKIMSIFLIVFVLLGFVGVVLQNL